LNLFLDRNGGIFRVYVCMRMMNPIELLAQVKKLVFQEETMPTPAYTLADGTKIMVSALEVGGIVTLEDGSPAPAGEHTLADGTEIVLAEGGVIAEIKPKEVEEPKVEIEVESGKDMEDKKDKMAALFSEIESRFADNEQKFSKLLSDYEQTKMAINNQFDAMQGLIQLVETLVNVPSQAPAEVPNNFKKVSVETKADRIRNYSNFVSQFKNK
jgi:hypothetical protein